jgi:UDP-N-acetylglucosamine 4,6-dehydratase/5-epimerase
MLNGKSILITGGTGSFGKKLTQTVLDNYQPRQLIIFSRDELKQFEMAQQWSPQKYPCLRYLLGDVRDRDRLLRAFHGVDYIVHAAALKQVPAAENNPAEFIKTNIIGAMNIIDAALFNKVEKVVALSTDKASNPINLYGATKLCSDKLFTAANVYSGSTNGTIFSVVRYGNVLGSRGSVIPFFKERASTGNLPITDARMTRFWITLGQAVHFVLHTMALAKGGEIFVPRIPSMKITDLATAIAPGCKQEIIGIRAGEKLHESMISPDDARNTVAFKDCYVIQADAGKRSQLMEGEGDPCPDGFEYTSKNNDKWMGVDELRELIEQIADDYTIEKSRWSMDDVPA